MGTSRLPGALFPRLSDERGVTLVETLISAVILAIVVGAVLATIDASGRTTTVNKNRTIAATLAEQDQERMRAMTPTALANHTLGRDLDVGGVSYHVDSKVDWVFDATGATESCENDSGQANYLRITSTVTSSVVGTRVRPVTMRSIVSPRVDSFGNNAGTLTVKVTDQLGAPVQGMTVSISPAASLPRDTNEFGCAVFSHIPAGAYTATLDRAGWVNELRQQRFDKSTTVQKNDTTAVSMTYAMAAAVEVAFKTDSNTASEAPSAAHALTVSNTKSGEITFPATGTTPVGTLKATSLFPYPDGYTAYAGRCALNDPTAPEYPANVNYFTSLGYPGFTNVTPGQVTTVEAHQPSVNLKIVDKDNNPLTGARVVFTPSPAECGPTPTMGRFARLTQSGFLVDRGLPFGTYTACATLDATKTQGRNLGVITNTSPAGTAPAQHMVRTSDKAACSP
jgi:Tfp pilus assembly protein PilV